MSIKDDMASHVLGCKGMNPLLVVAVAVRHGEDVGVEDAELGLEGEDGVFALVVLATAAVGVCENTCRRRKRSSGDYKTFIKARWKNPACRSFTNRVHTSLYGKKTADCAGQSQ